MSAKKTLRVLHTSDWHLGQKLINQTREKEQTAALDWLFETIVEQGVEVLVVSGDIFDTHTPSTLTESVYYRFLARLIPTPCRHIVITGGNHDSPSRLNAPASLLGALHMHVIGVATQNLDEEVLVLADEQGEPEIVIAAVPFLRDQNLLPDQMGASIDERRKGIRSGIKKHFDEVGAICAALQLDHLPKICMAHLFVGGTEAPEEQANIYLGDEHNMAPSDFHPVFNYVALGHIHRAQKLNKAGSIRYCGSMIPLSFSELNQKKIVCLVDFEGAEVKQIKELAVPQTRKLVKIVSNMTQIRADLEKHAAPPDDLTTWAEVIIESDQPIPQMHHTLVELAYGLNIQILKHRNITTQEVMQTAQRELEQIEHLDPLEVFERKCRKEGYSDEEIKELKSDFNELREWMQTRVENG